MKFLLLFFLAFLWPDVAELAQPCIYLAGGCPSENVLVTSTIPTIGTFLATIAAGLGVVFMILSGYKMLLSFGEEGKITQGRWGVIYAALGLSLAIGSQLIVSFVVTDTGFGTITASAGGGWSAGSVAALTTGARILVFSFNALFLLIVVLGGMRMLLGRGQQEEFNRGRTMVAWAIGGAVVVNAAWALIRAVTAFFGV